MRHRQFDVEALAHVSSGLPTFPGAAPPTQTYRIIQDHTGLYGHKLALVVKHTLPHSSRSAKAIHRVQGTRNSKQWKLLWHFSLLKDVSGFPWFSIFFLTHLNAKKLSVIIDCAKRSKYLSCPSALNHLSFHTLWNEEANPQSCYGFPRPDNPCLRDVVFECLALNILKYR